MSKPTMIAFDASNPIEDLNTNLDVLASKFDGALVDSDISSVSYSKLILGGNIVNADINASAGIVGTKLAANTIAGGASNQLALSTVALVNMVVGAVAKLTAPILSTAAITNNTSATEADVTGATISYTPAESGSKILIIGQATGSRVNGSPQLQIGINVAGVTQTYKPYAIFNTGTQTVACFYTYTFGSGTAQTVKLICNNDGSGGNGFTIALGEAMIMIVEFKRSA